MSLPNDATLRQIEAADPNNSTWLAANAGSGKTRVLTDRVARLLLQGVDPQNILCLTYTKAAASEMQNRLFKRLGAWAMMDRDKLQQQLLELGVEGSIHTEQLLDARRLFARAIETPGGLKIQTIHSFCSSILRRFPLEAGVSPQFTEMEERAAFQLRADVIDQIAEDQPALLAKLSAHFTGEDLAEFTSSIVSKKDAFLRPVDDENLRQVFNLTPNAQRSDAISIAFNGSEEGIAHDVKEAFKNESKTYQTFAQKLSQVFTLGSDWAALESLFSLLLYSDKTSKSRNFPQSNHKKAVEAAEHIADDLHLWMDRTAAAYQFTLSFNAYERTRALYEFAQVFVPAYEQIKLLRGALDFDDLIRKARALLTDPVVADWVLYRLDGGIDHILVDEAQDTSPEQWAVVELLSREFATGEGAHSDKHRTIFVVGDKKQSIYSFQGADPREFDRMREHFATELPKVDDALHDLQLEFSFRSSYAILQLVDAVFQGPMKAGLGDHLHHRTFKSDMPGRVDIWPVVENTDQDDADLSWFDPVDRRGALHPNVVLADQIAGQIQSLIQQKATIPEEIGNTGHYNHRPITEGDFLILVQRRSALFSEIIRACKARNLNIAGADRLKIGAELAVKDITALMKFLALPEDDLSLAAALRSPLFGWSEQDLFTAAHNRPKHAYLWQHIRQNPIYATTVRPISDLLANADFLRPYDLIEQILIRHGGRKSLLARLGAEAEDGIDALLGQALIYEQNDVPSLTGFLSWLESEEVEIKRQMDSQGDRIRVMTVHGAKGLEAPIVILPDTGKRKKDVRAELWPASDHIMWKTKAPDMPEAMVARKEDLIEAQEEERRRLLYVALTRAEKWLIVCASGDVGDENDSWYRMIETGMTRCGATKEEYPDGDGMRLSHLDWNPGELDIPEHRPLVTVETPQYAAVEMPKSTDVILTPSDLGGAKALPGEQGEADEETAMLRGSLIHLLLEHLPNHPRADWQNVSQDLIANNDDFVGLNTDHIFDDVAKVLEKSDLAFLFNPGSLAEVELTAALPELNNQRIHGVIDRLIVKDDHILIVDFKTNRVVPDIADQTPLGLLRQMGAYASAMHQIYPSHRIETAILWTETATLMTLPAELVTLALNSVSEP